MGCQRWWWLDPAGKSTSTAVSAHQESSVRFVDCLPMVGGHHGEYPHRYYMGIVDILERWTLRKRIEWLFKVRTAPCPGRIPCGVGYAPCIISSTAPHRSSAPVEPMLHGMLSRLG